MVIALSAGLRLLAEAPISTKEVFTCPDLFTKIVVRKEDLNEVTTTAIDSVKCTKGKKNVYTVNY